MLGGVKTSPMLEGLFYHDGRGPELQKIYWRGAYPIAFDYYNPDDTYDSDHLKHLLLVKPEAFSFAGEEVHGNILATGKSNASIFKVINSIWLKSFNQRHLANCSHYQVMFYDEIFDIVCQDIEAHVGGYRKR